VELLAYHRYGLNKYRMLWRPYELEQVLPPEAGTMEAAAARLRVYGVSCSHT